MIMFIMDGIPSDDLMRLFVDHSLNRTLVLIISWSAIFTNADEVVVVLVKGNKSTGGSDHSS